MTVDARASPIGSVTRAALAGNPEAAARLPAPDKTYGSDDLSQEVARVFRRFRAAGIIKSVGDSEYRTNPAAYEVAEALAADRSTLPCGHGGLQNCRDGGYSCGEPTCDARFDRETAKRLFASDE